MPLGHCWRTHQRVRHQERGPASRSDAVFPLSQHTKTSFNSQCCELETAVADDEIGILVCHDAGQALQSRLSRALDLPSNVDYCPDKTPGMDLDGMAHSSQSACSIDTGYITDVKARIEKIWAGYKAKEARSAVVAGRPTQKKKDGGEMCSSSACMHLMLVTNNIDQLS